MTQRDERLLRATIWLLLALTGLTLSYQLLTGPSLLLTELGLAAIAVLLALLVAAPRFPLKLTQDLLLGSAFVIVATSMLLDPDALGHEGALLLGPLILGAFLRRPLLSIIGMVGLLTLWFWIRLREGQPLVDSIGASLPVVVPSLLLLSLPYLRQADHDAFHRLHNKNQDLQVLHDDLTASLQQVNDFLARFTIDGRIIFCSAAAREILQQAGWSGHQGDPLPAGALATELDRLFEDGRQGRPSYLALSANRQGLLRTYVVTPLVQRDANNVVHGYVLLGHDAAADLVTRKNLDHVRVQLFNALSHELNSPLTPVMLQLHMLTKNAALGPLTPGQTHALEVVERNLQRLRDEHRRLADAILEGEHAPQVWPPQQWIIDRTPYSPPKGVNGHNGFTNGATNGATNGSTHNGNDVSSSDGAAADAAPGPPEGTPKP